MSLNYVILQVTLNAKLKKVRYTLLEIYQLNINIQLFINKREQFSGFCKKM